MEIAKILNSHCLKPINPHEAHDLYDRIPLELSGVETREDSTFNVKICDSCKKELRRETPTSNPPRYTLANNMWIGRVPWEFEHMTLPEQMLIALLYPRVFVFKLHNKSGLHSSSTLQRGMHGTVCTYELDMDGIASMLQGNLMPRPLSILSSIISVTFVGREKLNLKSLHKLFHVRRQVVLEAPVWLKTYPNIMEAFPSILEPCRNFLKTTYQSK